MNYDPEKHHRRSIRLRGYDYSQAGYYFVTICCYQRQRLFGDIVNGAMQLNEYGEIVKQEWLRSAVIRTNIELDEFIVMPNHFHGIIIIDKNLSITPQIARANSRSPLRQSNKPIMPLMKPKSLSSLMAGFKSSVTKQINTIRYTPGSKIWQRNYYEHIIRNEKALNNIRQYIINNPLSWDNDQLHPDNPSKW